MSSPTGGGTPAGRSTSEANNEPLGHQLREPSIEQTRAAASSSAHRRRRDASDSSIQFVSSTPRSSHGARQQVITISDDEDTPAPPEPEALDNATLNRLAVATVTFSAGGGSEHRVYVAVQIFASPRSTTYPPLAHPHAGNYVIGAPFYEMSRVPRDVRHAVPHLPPRLRADGGTPGWEWLPSFRNAVHQVRSNAIAEQYWETYRAWLPSSSGVMWGHNAWYNERSQFNHQPGPRTRDGYSFDILPHHAPN